MKDLEERDARAQQRKELAKRCKGCHVCCKKGLVQQESYQDLRQSARALAAMKWRISIHLLSRSLPQVIIPQLAQSVGVPFGL